MEYGTGDVYKISDTCRTPEESTLRANFHDQLSPSSGAFYNKWPGGYTMTRYPNSSACEPTNTVDELVDIRLNWEPYSTWYTSLGRGNYGGITTDVLGSSSWCAIWGDSYPCGFHISTIELNQYRFDNVYSDAYGASVLVHESGHSMGFNDYCGGGTSGYESISEDDVSCTNSFGVYRSIDRKRLADTIYANR